MERNKDFPNFWTAVLILVLLVGLQITIAGFLFDLGFEFEWGDPLASGVIMLTSYAIFFAVLLKYKEQKFIGLFDSSPNSVSSILAVLFVPLALVVGSSIFWISDITSLMMLRFPSTQEEGMALVRIFSGGAISFLLICIIAPVAEEALFRGVILKSFLQSYSVNASIILSSLLFALYHLTIIQIPVAFVIGCFLGWLFVKTRSLWAPVLGHFLYNAMIMIMWAFYYSDEVGDSLPIEFNPPAVLLVSVLFTVLGVYILYQILSSKGSGASHAR